MLILRGVRRNDMKALRRNWIALACFGMALIGTTSCTTPGQRDGVVELFNGHNLTGWSHVLADATVPEADVWSVQDGVLTCTGDPVGFLYRGPQVTDFRMVVEYRWKPGTPPGNSGIFSRINGTMGALPQTVEVQLKHAGAGDVMGLQGRKVDAAQPRFFSVKKHPLAGDIAGVKALEYVENAAGEWNRVEILALGPRYTVWMNGKLVNQATGVEVVPGLVGLQSEGGAIQFRRVTLTPLGR